MRACVVPGTCAKRHSATCQTYFEVYRATVVLCEWRPKRHNHSPPLSSLVASSLKWMRSEFHAHVAHRVRRSPWVLSLNAKAWKARTSSIYTDAGVLKLVLALMCICYARAPGRTRAKCVRKKREFVSRRLEERKGCRCNDASAFCSRNPLAQIGSSSKRNPSTSRVALPQSDPLTSFVCLTGRCPRCSVTAHG